MPYQPSPAEILTPDRVAYIRQRRAALGWSMQQLADAADTSDVTIVHLEQGARQYSQKLPAVIAALEEGRTAAPPVKGDRCCVECGILLVGPPARLPAGWWAGQIARGRYCQGCAGATD